MRLTPSMRRALTLEVGMQNARLGTTLALSLFPDRPAVAIPGALYTFGCMLAGTLLAQYWGARGADSRGVLLQRRRTGPSQRVFGNLGGLRKLNPLVL